MENIFVINIGRQLGSGGRMVGEILAKKLNIAFFDKELIQLASEKSGLGKEFFEKVDEQTTHSIWGGLLNIEGGRGVRCETSDGTPCWAKAGLGFSGLI